MSSTPAKATASRKKATPATAAAPAPAAVAAPAVVATPAPAAPAVAAEKKPRAKKAAVTAAPAAPAAVAAPATPAVSAEKKSRKRPRTEAAPSTESAPVTAAPVVADDAQTTTGAVVPSVVTSAAAKATPSRRSAVPYVALPKVMDFSEEALAQARQHFQWFARHATRNRIIRLYKDVALQVYNELRTKSQKVIDNDATNARYKQRLSTMDAADFKSLHGKWLSDFSIKGKYTFEQARDLLVKQGKIEEDPKSARIGLLLAACTAHKVKPLGIVSEARDVNKNYIVSLDADEAKRVYVGPTIMFKGLEGHKLAFDLRKDSVYVPRDKLPRGVRRVTSLFPATSSKKKAISSGGSSDASGAVSVPVTV